MTKRETQAVLDIIEKELRYLYSRWDETPAGSPRQVVVYTINSVQWEALKEKILADAGQNE